MENNEINGDVSSTETKTDESVFSAIEPETDWKAEALKYKAIAERKAKQQEKLQEPVAHDEDLRKTVETLSLAEQKRQTGYKLNLDPQETDELFAYAKGKGVAPEEAVKTTGGKALVDALRAERRLAQATPPPSNKSVSVEGKTWKEMSTEERKKNFNQVFKR